MFMLLLNLAAGYILLRVGFYILKAMIKDWVTTGTIVFWVGVVAFVLTNIR